MRILFSGVPAYGHLLPFAPLMAAALDDNHVVAVLTSQGVEDLVRTELPESVEHLTAGPMPLEFSEETARRTGQNVFQPTPRTIGEIFGGTRLDTTLGEGLDCARAWRPDLVIAEVFDTVGPFVAAALDIPWHQAALGPALPGTIADAIDLVAAERYAARGLAPVPASSYIDPCPPLLQEPEWTSAVPRRPVRPQAHRRSAQTTAALDLPVAKGTRVLVTMGTIFSEPKILDAVVEAIRPLAMDVVVTEGFSLRAPDEVGPDGAAGTSRRAGGEQVRYVPFTPLEQLLDGVDAVIGAGGVGTLLATLSRGLPTVLWPQGADQEVNAARAVAGGVATGVRRPDEIAAALRGVLQEESYRSAARRVAAEIAAMPLPREVLCAVTGA